MNTFINAFETRSNRGITENGADKYTTSGDAMLDMFSQIGAMRDRTEREVVTKYRSAFMQDSGLATKMLFYARNCRGGLGERKTFRTILRWLANNHPAVIRANIQNIPFYGRFDDLYELVATPCEKAMWQFVRLQWLDDLASLHQGKPCSIMAKWLKSVNCSNKQSCAFGAKTARELGLSEAQYRKTLSKLRAHLKVCEKTMSAGEWKKIAYSEVPSYAMKQYKAAFCRHDPAGFGAYKHDLMVKMEEGTLTSKDIKSSTLYPYDLVREYLGYNRWDIYDTPATNAITEAQWKALPNYIEGENNVLVMADVSGSMFTANMRPISASVGLAIYFAQHNHGVFKGKYMTFSSRPEFISIDTNATLHDTVNQVRETGMGYSTNLELAFDTLLRACECGNVKAEDMPKAIVVISDMEIDRYRYESDSMDFLSEMAERFKRAGYTMPKCVMWNVEGRGDTYLAKANSPYVQFVSGSSASTFNDLLGAITCNARELMLKTLNNPIYDRVVTVF